MPDLTKPRRGAGTLSKFLLCTAAALAIAPAAKAQEWTGANSNDWFDAGNWSPATVPAIFSDDARIDIENGPIVTAPGAGTSQMFVGIDHVGALFVRAGGFTGSLNASYLGFNTDSSGVVDVSGVGATYQTLGNVFVGYHGHGEFDISNSGALQMFAGTLSVGVFSDGSGELTADNHATLFSNAIHVGEGGFGSFTLSNSSTATGSGVIGYLADTSGTALVTSGSSWNSNSLIVGYVGAGDLTVSGGGAMTTQTTSLGVFDVASGSVKLTGAGSTWTNSDTFTVGDAGAGDLTISHGATMEVVGPSTLFSEAFIVANQVGSTGSVTVTGAGSTLTIDGFQATWGKRGEGSLTISNGGVVHDSVNVFGFDTGGSGSGLITGNGSLFDTLAIAVGNDADGDFTVTNRGAATAQVVAIGVEDGSTGTVLVDQHGTLSTSTLTVGIDGVGDLTVASGGRVEAFDSIVGQSLGAGTVHVTGAGSAFASDDELTIGESGAGLVFAANGGVVSAANDITLARSISALGVLVVGGDFAPEAPGTINTPQIVFGSGDAILAFNHTSSNYTFAPSLVSGGSFGEVDFLAGTTKLTGDSSSFFGESLVESGASAFFNGSIKGDISVFGGGFAGGDGTIAGMFVDSGGTLSPGASATLIGTLNALAITFAPGSVYRPKVDAAGNSDLLNVSGSFAIDGGTVAVAPQPGAYAHTTTYTIATTALGPLGVFDNVTSSVGFLVPTLEYVGNDIQLTLTVDDHVFTTAPITPNQINTAAAIKTMATDNPVWLGVVELNDSDARDAFSALSGNFLASLNGGGFNEPLQLFSTVQSRLLGIAEGPRAVQLASLADVGGVSAERRGVWGQIFGGVSSLDGDANAAGLDFTRGGLIVGADRGVGVDGRVGVSASYQRTNAEADGRVSEGDINSYGVSLYGGTKAGNFSVTGEVGYSLRDVSARRHVVAGALDETLHADYNANALHAQVRVGLPLEFGSSVVEPFGSVALVRVNTDGFTEKGGSAALTSGDSDNSVVFTSLGARVMHGFGPDGRNGGLFGSLAWRHASGDVAPDQRFAFASNPSATFAVTGAPIAEDAAALDAGFRAVLGPRTNMTIGYRGEFGDGSQDHTASVRFSFTH